MPQEPEPLPFGHTIQYETKDKQKRAAAKCLLAQAILENALDKLKALGVTPKLKNGMTTFFVVAERIYYMHPEK